MPPAYFASVDYYALALATGEGINTLTRFDKRRKQAHRCLIADVNGPLSLTVPVCRERMGDTWAGVRISDHGDWRQVHLTALESAYGRTPFFEFYIDRFLPCFQKGRFETVLDLDLFIDAEIRKIIQVGPPLGISRPVISTVPYYQIRACSLGFIPHLSILDLIFNVGPETPVILNKMIQPQG